MTRSVMPCVIVAWLCAGASPSLAARAGGAPAGSGSAWAAEQVTAALAAWLRQARAGELFLELDGTAGRLRLRHGAAVLRDCPLHEMALGGACAVSARLGQHLRWYRPEAPGATLRGGPFDWEDVLARAAADDDALYFDNGFLLYADPLWQSAGGPCARLEAGDLRALFEACPAGTPLVILPPGWKDRRDNAR